MTASISWCHEPLALAVVREVATPDHQQQHYTAVEGTCCRAITRTTGMPMWCAFCSMSCVLFFLFQPSSTQSALCRLPFAFKRCGEVIQSGSVSSGREQQLSASRLTGGAPGMLRQRPELLHFTDVRANKLVWLAFVPKHGQEPRQGNEYGFRGQGDAHGGRLSACMGVL